MADHKKVSVSCHPTQQEKLPLPKNFTGLSEKDFFISCSQFFNFFCISFKNAENVLE